MGKIAIFGFGRIGRQLLRVALQEKLFVPVSISDIRDEETLAALFEVDTNYKRWPEEVQAKTGAMVIGGRQIKYINSTNEVPDWKALGVDLVIDCTGQGRYPLGCPNSLGSRREAWCSSADQARVEDCDAVLLKGINLDSFNPDEHKIISMASCTTNALAPVVKLVRENSASNTDYSPRCIPIRTRNR